MSQRDIEALLKSFDLFKDCEINTQIVKHKTYKKGRIISDNESGQSCVVFVVHGSIEVYSVALDGKEIMLSLLEKGDCFGISNLFLEEEELRTVLKCSEDSSVLLIPKPQLIEMMRKDGTLAVRLAALYNRKIEFLLKKIEFLTMQSGKGKVAEFLLSQADDSGIIRLSHSKENLACMLGISRASLFRELSYFQSHDMISQEQNCIRIQNRKKLEAVLYQCSS
ncbi:MAG: Crp/Fnr family transcriptional regulator [Lachnospiraceae bacterium]